MDASDKLMIGNTLDMATLRDEYRDGNPRYLEPSTNTRE